MSDRNIILFGILKTKKEVYKLNKERISIGRNRLSQIVINNNTISNEPKLVSEIQTHKPDNGGITSNTQTMVPYKKASIIQKIILKIKKKIGRKK